MLHVAPPGITTDRVGYAITAANRLCGLRPASGCELTLLCTRCGTNPTLRMASLKAMDGRTTSDLNLTTIDGVQRLLVPPIIVLDAISVICASVVPGAGLAVAIRPIQGPMCKTCIDSTSNSSPQYPPYATSDEFADGCKQLFNSMQTMKLDDSSTHVSSCVSDAFVSTGCDCSSDASPCTKPPCGSGVFVRTGCDCRSSLGVSPCTNSCTSKMCSLSTFTPVPSSFSFLIGHGIPNDESGVGGVSNEGETISIYDLCVVDSGLQKMCHMTRPTPGSSSISVVDGVFGQSNYKEKSNVCDSLQVDMVGGAGLGTIFTPSRTASCLVCSKLLDTSGPQNVMDFTFRGERSVYLAAHHNWVHYDCSVSCEKQFAGICMGRCPRLNTLVDRTFAVSHRFENVCAACVDHDSASDFPAFSKDFRSPATSSAETGCFASISYTSSNPDKSKHCQATVAAVPSGTAAKTLKRPASSNWLASATTMRKKAAMNAIKKPANSKLTPKESRNREAAFVFTPDLSGVFVQKNNNTWYTLDVKGENPSPVSGMPFFDPVFNEIRVWQTLEERKNAISLHQLRNPSVDEM
jgi:hypothetical protein